MSKRRDMPKFPDELIEAGFKLRDELNQRFLDKIKSPWHQSGYGRAFEVGRKILTAPRPKKRKSPMAEKVLKILRKDPKRRTDLIVKKVGCSTVYVNRLRREFLEKKRN